MYDDPEGIIVQNGFPSRPPCTLHIQILPSSRGNALRIVVILLHTSGARYEECLLAWEYDGVQKPRTGTGSGPCPALPTTLSVDGCRLGRSRGGGRGRGRHFCGSRGRDWLRRRRSGARRLRGGATRRCRRLSGTARYITVEDAAAVRANVHPPVHVLVSCHTVRTRRAEPVSGVVDLDPACAGVV